MTRDEHLQFCKKCTNRRLDLQVGLVCDLTGKIADFEKECPSFKFDETVVEKKDDQEAVDHSQVLETLSEESLAKFKLEQDLPKAVLAGVVVGIVGALLWGVITVATGYQIGYMAVAIGAGVGFSMRIFGKGIDQVFGITGGLIAVLSCLLGNFFGIVGFIAEAQDLGFFETLELFDYNQLVPIMVETFSPMDLLFYGIAAYEGYKFAFRTFTEKDLHEIGKQGLVN